MFEFWSTSSCNPGLAYQYALGVSFVWPSSILCGKTKSGKDKETYTHMMGHYVHAGHVKRFLFNSLLAPNETIIIFNIPHFRE